jgi:hypothetical protein
MRPWNTADRLRLSLLPEKIVFRESDETIRLEHQSSAENTRNFLWAVVAEA